jgi:hypothetical protein
MSLAKSPVNESSRMRLGQLSVVTDSLDGTSQNGDDSASECDIRSHSSGEECSPSPTFPTPPNRHKKTTNCVADRPLSSPPLTSKPSLSVVPPRPRLSFGISQILQNDSSSSSSCSSSHSTSGSRQRRQSPSLPGSYSSIVEYPAASLGELYRQHQQATAPNFVFSSTGPHVGFAVVAGHHQGQPISAVSSARGGGLMGCLPIPGVIRVPAAQRFTQVCTVGQQTIVTSSSAGGGQQTAPGGLTAAAVTAAACRLSAMMFPWMRERKDGMTCELKRMHLFSMSVRRE